MATSRRNGRGTMPNPPASAYRLRRCSQPQEAADLMRTMYWLFVKGHVVSLIGPGARPLSHGGKLSWEGNIVESAMPVFSMAMQEQIDERSATRVRGAHRTRSDGCL